MKENNLNLDQVWKISKRFLKDFTYDSGLTNENEWVYTSFESSDHKNSFETWLKSKNIDDNEKIWVIFDNKPKDTIEIEWKELFRSWTSIFCDENIIITNTKFTWVVEYDSQKISRFGRKYSKQK